MNVRAVDSDTSSLGPGARSKRTTICSDTSPAEEEELNMWRWITRGNDTQRCPLLPADGFIFNYLRQMFPGLPFLRKVAVTKLIHIIIERGFNEGEMFLTFECHSLPPPAVLRLLTENGYAVTAISGSFHQKCFSTAATVDNIFIFMRHIRAWPTSANLKGLYHIVNYYYL